MTATTEFVFDGMTPELAAYLARPAEYKAQADSTWPLREAARKAWEAAGKPTDGDLLSAFKVADAAHYGGLHKHSDETQRMLKSLPDGLAARYHAARKTWMCRDETIAGDPIEHASESGRYRLVVTKHATGKGTWAYSRGRVYDGERLVAEVCRNYSAFPFLFVEGHPCGDFLVCGEDYQGSAVVELATGRVVSAGTSNFCWASYTASPSKRTLAVEGCYWAAPYEMILVDFADPMCAPLPVLANRGMENFVEWIGPDSCVYGRAYEVYVPLNKPVEDLTDEETDEYERRLAAGEKGLTRMEFVDRVEWHRHVKSEANDERSIGDGR